MTTTGTRTAEVLTALAEAGVTKRAIVAELALAGRPVSLRTVQRWATGTTPKPANLTALRTLVDNLIAESTAAAVIASHAQVEALQRAKDALLTDVERATLDDLAARVNAHLDGIQRASVTTRVDPFILCAADRFEDKLDKAFGAAA